MGTRNLTCVVVGGEYKVAQYGQFDGYPSGQGATILAFLSKKLDRAVFLEKIAKTFQPTEEQVAAWWMEVGHDIKSGNGFVDYKIAEAYKEKHPSLGRETSGGILELIQSSSDPVPLKLSTEFAGDSLFCEFAYVVDFDKNTFEVFKGFNQEPITEGERFSELSNDGKSNGYQAVKLFHTFDMASLPTYKQFIEICEPSED